MIRGLDGFGFCVIFGHFVPYCDRPFRDYFVWACSGLNLKQTLDVDDVG